MRKRLISICTTLILVSGIYGCTQTAEETPVAETVGSALYETEAECEEVSDKEESNKTVAGEEQEQGEAEADPMSNIAPQYMFDYKFHDNSIVITGLQAQLIHCT